MIIPEYFCEYCGYIVEIIDVKCWNINRGIKIMDNEKYYCPNCDEYLSIEEVSKGE